MPSNDTQNEKTVLPARVRALIFDDSIVHHENIEREAIARIPGIQFFHNPQSHSPDPRLQKRHLNIRMWPLLRKGVAAETIQGLEAENQKRKKVLSEALLDTWPHLIFVDINGGDGGGPSDGLVVLDALETARRESGHHAWWEKWPRVVIVSDHANADMEQTTEDLGITKEFDHRWLSATWAPICRIGKFDMYGSILPRKKGDVIRYASDDHKASDLVATQWSVIWAKLSEVYTPDERLLPNLGPNSDRFKAEDHTPEQPVERLRGLSWANFLFAQKFENHYVLWFRGDGGNLIWRQLGVHRDDQKEWWDLCTRGLPVVRIEGVDLDEKAGKGVTIFLNVLMIDKISMLGDEYDIGAIRFKVDLNGCNKDIRLRQNAFDDFETEVIGKFGKTWNLARLKGPEPWHPAAWIGQLGELRQNYKETVKTAQENIRQARKSKSALKP